MFASSTEVTTEISVTIQEAAAGRIAVNVAGFSMGNSLIEPVVQSMAYGALLYELVSNATQSDSNATFN